MNRLMRPVPWPSVSAPIERRHAPDCFQCGGEARQFLGGVVGIEQQGNSFPPLRLAFADLAGVEQHHSYSVARNHADPTAARYIDFLGVSIVRNAWNKLHVCLPTHSKHSAFFAGSRSGARWKFRAGVAATQRVTAIYSQIARNVLRCRTTIRAAVVEILYGVECGGSACPQPTILPARSPKIPLSGSFGVIHRHSSNLWRKNYSLFTIKNLEAMS